VSSTPTPSVRFGPAGIPSITEGGTFEGIKDVAKIGLSAMEVEFVRGVRMGKEQAEKIAEEAKKLDVSLSCHAPYWINCCAKEQSKLDLSVRHLIESARAMESLGGGVVVFHPGYYMGRSSEECANLSEETLSRVLEMMKHEKITHVRLGAETVGKLSQYGDLFECINLSNHFGQSHLIPVPDFGHLHARGNGCIKNKSDYEKILDQFDKSLPDYLKHFHSHFSELEYSEKGERNHIPLGSNEPPFSPLAELLAERGCSGTVVCESPLLEQDALKMQAIYSRFLKK